MNKPVKPAKQGLKSASDFEQWLNEIYLFAHETQAELHEIAGALNLALASDPLGDLNERSRLSLSLNSVQHVDADREFPQQPTADSDVQMASLQRKLAQQLKSSQISIKAAQAHGSSHDAKFPSGKTTVGGESRPSRRNLDI